MGQAPKKAHVMVQPWAVPIPSRVPGLPRCPPAALAGAMRLCPDSPGEPLLLPALTKLVIQRNSDNAHNSKLKLGKLKARQCIL